MRQQKINYLREPGSFSRRAIVLNSEPVDGDTITINGVVFTFKDSPVEVTDVPIVSGQIFGDLKNAIENAAVASKIEGATYLIQADFITPIENSGV
jgi:transcription elongation factor